MSARHHARVGCVTGLVLACVAACGGADSSVFGSGASSSGSNGDGGTGALGSSGNGGTSSGGVGSVGGVTPSSACATSSAGTVRPPSYLVFMYDRSKSMDDDVGGTTKWLSCKTGLESFFASASSAGIQASLTFFGEDGNSSDADCSASSYATPQVAMGPLPNATAYSSKLGATSPTTDTPTLPALQGAIQYAKKVQAGLKDNGKVAVVLVTDGDPHGCNGNSVTAVANAAAAVAATIPTYVVGIGDSLANLKTIAAGGGTTAILISTSSPTQVTSDLEKALGQIAASQLGCDYALPAPPTGQTLNVNAVNVDYTPAGAAQTTLSYSADCSNPDGWHYDSTGAPTKVIMCPSICSTLKADQGGKIDIVFGCTTSIPDGGTLPVR